MGRSEAFGSRRAQPAVTPGCLPDFWGKFSDKSPILWPHQLWSGKHASVGRLAMCCTHRKGRRLGWQPGSGGPSTGWDRAAALVGTSCVQLLATPPGSPLCSPASWDSHSLWPRFLFLGSVKGAARRTPSPSSSPFQEQAVKWQAVRQGLGMLVRGRGQRRPPSLADTWGGGLFGT